MDSVGQSWFPSFAGNSTTVVSALFVLLTICYSLWDYYFTRSTSSLFNHRSFFFGTPVISACTDPNCLRCQRYRQMQDRAMAKIVWIVQDFKRSNPTISLNPRIQHGVQRSKRDCQQDQQHLTTTSNKDDGVDDRNPFQAPTVLWVPCLPSQEVVTHLHHEACQYLRQQPTCSIVLDSLRNFSDTDWTTNNSPKGSWKVFHIMNQGSWNPYIVHQDKEEEDDNDSPSVQSPLAHLIRGIPGLLDKCLFGNVMISTIDRRTIIEPHCGPTNVRHRLQFLLEIPAVDRQDSLSTSSESTSIMARGPHQKQALSLFVGKDQHLKWNPEDPVFVFDDSYVHSVHYKSDQNTREGAARTVLIVDLWHPGLDEVEKELLRDLYPPFKNVRPG